MRLLSFFVGVLAGFSVLAGGMPPARMVAPPYRTLIKMGNIANVLAEGGRNTNLPKRNVEDLAVHSIAIKADKKGNESAETVVVEGNKSVNCSLKIEVIVPPKGIAGAPEWKPVVKSCTEALPFVAQATMKWEEVAKLLGKAAKAGRVNQNFTISGQKGNEKLIWDVK